MKPEIRLTLSEYRRATVLTRDCTAFCSFAALLTAQTAGAGGYRPVFWVHERPGGWRKPSSPQERLLETAERRRRMELAELYDRAQLARGDARRAVRL